MARRSRQPKTTKAKKNFVYVPPHECSSAACNTLRNQLASPEMAPFLRHVLSKACVGVNETVSGESPDCSHIDLQLLLELGMQLVDRHETFAVQDQTKRAEIQFLRVEEKGNHQLTFVSSITLICAATNTTIETKELTVNVSAQATIMAYHSHIDSAFGVFLCNVVTNRILSLLPTPPMCPVLVSGSHTSRGTFDCILGLARSKAAFWKDKALHGHLPQARFNESNHCLLIDLEKGCVQVSTSGTIGVMGVRRPSQDVALEHLPAILAAAFCVSGLATTIEEAKQVLLSNTHNLTKARRGKTTKVKAAARRGPKTKAKGRAGSANNKAKAANVRRRGRKSSSSADDDDEEPDYSTDETEAESEDETDEECEVELPLVPRSSSRIASKRDVVPSFGSFHHFMAASFSSSSSDGDTTESESEEEVLSGKKRRADEEEADFVPVKKQVVVITMPPLPQRPPSKRSPLYPGAAKQQQQQEDAKDAFNIDFVTQDAVLFASLVDNLDAAKKPASTTAAKPDAEELARSLSAGFFLPTASTTSATTSTNLPFPRFKSAFRSDVFGRIPTPGDDEVLPLAIARSFDSGEEKNTLLPVLEETGAQYFSGLEESAALGECDDFVDQILMNEGA